MKQSPAAVASRVRMRSAQDKVIQLVAEGVPASTACKQVGRSTNTFYRHWMKDGDFKDRLLRARAIGGDPHLAGADFIRFRKNYFDRDTPAHHATIIEAIESAEPDSITMILAPPEAAKTSLIVDYVNWLLGPVDPNYRVCVISEGQDLSRKMLAQIGQRMTDEALFPAYIKTYGPFKVDPQDKKRSGGYDRDTRKPWNADYFTVLKSAHDEKEPSVEARGAGSTIYGGRYDLIVLDDIQSGEKLAQTAKLLGYLRLTVFTRPAKGKGKIIILGTRVGPGDIYETLLNEGVIDRLVQIKALDRPLLRETHFDVLDNKAVARTDHGAVSYWPEYWDMQSLAVRRHKVGEAAWALAYMQNPADVGTATFTDDMVRRCLDPSRRIGFLNTPGEVVIGVDPAIGGWAGLVCCSYTYDRLYVRDVVNIDGLARVEDLLGLLERLALAHRPTKVIVEQDGWGKGYSADDRMRAMADRLRFDVIPHVTRRNKADPMIGVASMASSFSLAEISIPDGDDATRKAMRELLDELRKWRPNTPGRLLRQDLVMALWFCWRHWREERDTLEIDQPKLWRPTWVREKQVVGYGR